MKKDVNLIFFGLVVFLLISILGITLYYQETYKSLDASHQEAMDKIIDTECKLNDTLAEVEAKSAELDQRERDLIDIYNELNISKQKISSLSSFYEEVSSEKDNLEDKINFAEADRDRYKLSLDEASQELLVCERDKELFSDEVSEANSKILEARGKLEENMSKAVLILDTYLDNIKNLLDEEIGGEDGDIEKILDELEDVKDDFNECGCSDTGSINSTIKKTIVLMDHVDEAYSDNVRSRNILNNMNIIINKLTRILVTV